MLLLWLLPLTALSYMLNVAVDAWIRGSGGSPDALGVFRAASAVTFVPAMLLLASAWGFAAPLSDLRAARSLANGLRMTCVLSCLALCLLMGHRLVARNVPAPTPATPWLMQTLHLRTLSGWMLLILAPAFGLCLHAFAAAQARAAGYSRLAYAWTWAATLAAIAMVALLTGDQLADWLWNSSPTYTQARAPNGLYSMTPNPTSPGAFDPERFYFIRILLCSFVGMWGAIIWVSLAWLRSKLDRVPRPATLAPA
jgi:hypothetical protein